MKLKTTLLASVVVFILGIAMLPTTVFAAQTDYYGTWGEIYNNAADDWGIIRFIVSADQITFTEQGDYLGDTWDYNLVCDNLVWDTEEVPGALWGGDSSILVTGTVVSVNLASGEASALNLNVAGSCYFNIELSNSGTIIGFMYSGDSISWQGRTDLSELPAELVYTGSTSIPKMTVGTPITPLDLNDGISGGSGNYRCGIVNGELPAGLTLDGETCIISGTPTTAGAAGAIEVFIYDDEDQGLNTTVMITYGAVTRPLDNQPQTGVESSATSLGESYYAALAGFMAIVSLGGIVVLKFKKI